MVDVFERRQNVNRVVSDEDALCFKSIKPHWTVLYQVKEKKKKLELHLLELRPKRKNHSTHSKDGNEWYG